MSRASSLLWNLDLLDLVSVGLAHEPINTTLPLITGGPNVGLELTCSTGSWFGPPRKFRFAWLRDTTEVQVNSTGIYTLTAEDLGAVITCSVTARNCAGSDVAVSSNHIDPEP